ncbi:desulfoferrodoxin family protein [Methermicoccus shengliensis]|nr:MAG: Glycosyl transferase family 2 [Euryarchaeota archaeon 55_53]
MISVVCVYNDAEVLRRYLLPSLDAQSARHERILIDNTTGAFRSAASALNHGGERARGEYIMFVHQDVALLGEHWLDSAESLMEGIDDLGIAGVAGMSEQGRSNRERGRNVIVHGEPPMVWDWGNPIEEPERVQTLDECLAIVPAHVFRMLRFDEHTCSSWHAYVVDYSLSVQRMGLCAYAMPLPVHHASLGVRRKGLLELLMSLGSSYPEDYYDTIERMLRKHAHLPRIYTTCGEYSTRMPLMLQRMMRAPKDCYQTLIWRTREWARERGIPLPWARTSAQTYFNIEPREDGGESMVDAVLKKVNRPTGELNDFQKKHIPVIDAPERVRADEAFEVSVTVGEWVKHPNELGHFIEWIELYCGDVLLTRADLGPVLADPKVVFRIRLDESGTLRAVAKCNLHGVWESTKEIAVE